MGPDALLYRHKQDCKQVIDKDIATQVTSMLTARGTPFVFASGYGADGPYRDKKAYDLLIQSEAGFLSVTGTPEDPAKAGCSIADIAAGMYAYTGILAALLQRERTGEG